MARFSDKTARGGPEHAVVERRPRGLFQGRPRPEHQAIHALDDLADWHGCLNEVPARDRPQRAVNHFARWAMDLRDAKMKQRYYPAVDKADLFSQGYIAGRSGHSRGSTVDLTLVSLTAPFGELDMGTFFDFFGERSWLDAVGLTTVQMQNRALLQQTMKKHGFIPYSKEWWHFTLSAEPFPDTYFDFEIRDDLSVQ